MARRNGAATRSARMKAMATFVHRALEKEPEIPTISLSMTVAHFELEFGLKPDRILEYLKVLEKLEHFIIDEEADLIRKTTST